QCGSEMSASTRLRRDLVTLSHYDVLHILTHVQEPKCLAQDVTGVRADLAALAHLLGEHKNGVQIADFGFASSGKPKVFGCPYFRVEYGGVPPEVIEDA
ncbi:hypothetical protein TELCIR_17008, partial [Teladorsagia circumcincta]